MPEPGATTLAVLIDADNTSPKLATEIFAELAKYGTITVKRAYGDWTTDQLKRWKPHLVRNAIQPMQQFANTVGKNSSDSALIIDAMDLLYAGHLAAFCIVSSDSDFTRLATRLREAGKTVYGLGRRTTPEAFRNACDRFIVDDVLGQVDEPAEPTESGPAELPAPAAPPLPDLRRLLTRAVRQTEREDGWASVSQLGSYISQNDASFDARSYGYAKLSDLVRAQKYLELREAAAGNGFNQLWVRLRQGTNQQPAKKSATKRSQPAKRAAAKKATQPKESGSS